MATKAEKLNWAIGVLNVAEKTLKNGGSRQEAVGLIKDAKALIGSK